MTDEMAERYMSKITEDLIAEDNGSFNNDYYADEVYCQPEEKTQVWITFGIWITNIWITTFYLSGIQMVVWYSDNHLNNGRVFKQWSEYQTKFSLIFKWHLNNGPERLFLFFLWILLESNIRPLLDPEEWPNIGYFLNIKARLSYSPKFACWVKSFLWEQGRCPS